MRYFIDVMTGVPSVMFGLFIYIVLVVAQIGGTFAGWKGSVALSLLMLPVVARSSEVVLNLVPEPAARGGARARRAALARDLPDRAADRAAGPPHGLDARDRARRRARPRRCCSRSRSSTASSTNLGERMNSLPLQIFNDVSQAQDRLVQRAWGAALTLVLMILLVTLIARLVQRRSRLQP